MDILDLPVVSHAHRRFEWRESFVPLQLTAVMFPLESALASTIFLGIRA